MSVFVCSHCRTPLPSKDEFTGEEVRCPSCARLTVPLLSDGSPNGNDPFQTEPFLGDARADPPDPYQTSPYPVLPETPNDVAVTRIGRYRIERELGRGGFGTVYLAADEELGRKVAVKVPNSSRVSTPAEAEMFLAEARVLAQLDHPNIVTVYDVGKTDDGRCFIVSKYIEGSDLAARLERGQPPIAETVELVATVADALHYLHTHGYVHCDVKPRNILVDKTGRPFVADFGLVRKDEDIRRGHRITGTPAFMAPEMARGEGHRIDGRADIFSLGVVLYQLLTNRLPFEGQTISEVLDHVIHSEPWPPRQIDASIPRELERICLKALAKKATDRYTTAKDLADDLRHFLHALKDSSEKPDTLPVNDAPPAVVPKGLRAFDAHDADFFLELLPGPRDRNGLPDSLRFWKSRIEETLSEKTFSVGLVYGPSGCGKSSLVKAGLLPRLADHVLPIYLEATPKDTIPRLFKALKRACPNLPPEITLTDALASLRKANQLGKKVLIILDQFEQWLHAARSAENAELVAALRQCDGGNVQCLLMVRDDFWLAISRFMSELEVPLVEGENSLLVDLFDRRHAKKVLAAFGRAYGALSDPPDHDQEVFLQQAVDGLAENDRVIPIRLALFADMMKHKPWQPRTLKTIGGMHGLAATFLEEAFSARTAHPKHRFHEQAARTVLKALLPEAGSQIKGNSLSKSELRRISGYDNNPKAFDELLSLLDSELRLITPVDAEATPDSEEKERYQLTHDYLVPALREWLTRKQKETIRGRAELRLADRAALWNAHPANRYLPACWEWANILLFTKKHAWTAPQRKMMRQASRYYLTRAAVLAALFVVVVFAGRKFSSHAAAQVRATYAAGLVQALRHSDIEEVPDLIEKMEKYREWTDPLIRKELASAPFDSRQRLHASLALLPVDDSQVDYLFTRLLEASPREVAILRQALLNHKKKLIPRLWPIVERPREKPHRLRAAAALALFDPRNQRWNNVKIGIAEDLVSVNPLALGTWLDVLRPVRDKLLEPLTSIFRNAGRSAEQRLLTATILSEYAADKPDILAELTLAADATQFHLLFPKVEAFAKDIAPVFEKIIGRSLDEAKTNDEKEILAKQQANAAVALIRLGHGNSVWHLFDHSPDPRVRSYLIHRVVPLGVDPAVLLAQLEQEKKPAIQRALWLSLGNYQPDDLPVKDLIPRLLAVYRNTRDAGLHGTVEWLLRKWHAEKQLIEVDKELATGEIDDQRQWYINKQGQTMVVIRGPVEFLMGSPTSEADREGGPQGENERQHRRRISRSFAISAREVTIEQFSRFRKEHDRDKKLAPTADCPVTSVSWYDAAAYCNWLSQQEGIAREQWCYEPNSEGKYAAGMSVKWNYLHLKGYRLPSEAEWEFACRSNAITSRYYGETEELLGNYAWYAKNSYDRQMLPVGRLMPNDFGLFDMLGNAGEWVHDQPFIYPQGAGPFEDRERIQLRTTNESLTLRVIRGGSFLAKSLFVRCASRDRAPSVSKFTSVGFRVARTLRWE
ncbi:MAG: hypothetical protein KatS3mg105_0728 [Gemmatales bacterium]|nr:MAG: hypothetical protein KatS3mg105_0728 [Gemmatales bacterium]